jgi:hypothetical protein
MLSIGKLQQKKYGMKIPISWSRMSYRVFVFASSLSGTTSFQYPGVECLTEFLCLLQVLKGLQDSNILE